ncbi:MAG: hypothetical protein ACRDHZ_13645, partial [Ktedonobacteraceae bacterium]
MSISEVVSINSGREFNTSSISLQNRILAVIFVISFALDFKGAVGGSPIQFAMASLNTLAFLLLAVNVRVTLPRSGYAAFVFWGWLTFLSAGSVAALFFAVPFSRYIRTIYPFILFLEGFLVAWWVARDGRGARTLVTAMMYTALVSLFFTFWWGFHFTNETVGAIRYQILSPLIPFLIVVAAYNLFFARRKKLQSLIILVITFGIIALSVTRGMLLVVGIVATAVLLAWMWNVLRSVVFLPRPIGRAIFWGISAGVVALFTALAVSPETIGRWVNRGFGASHDATFWTRAAAVVGQWNQLWTHEFSWISGSGFGHIYQYAESFYHLVYPYISATSFNSPKWFPGEFMWITPLYYGG